MTEKKLRKTRRKENTLTITVVMTIMIAIIIAFSIGASSQVFATAVYAQQLEQPPATTVPPPVPPQRAIESEELTALDNITGIRFFDNTTGIAYLDDNSSKLFEMILLFGIEHSDLHYFGDDDNPVIYYAGEVPDAVLDEWGIVHLNDTSTTAPAITNGTLHDVSIFRAEERSSAFDNCDDPTEISDFDPNHLVIKIGDTVRWTNYDFQGAGLSSIVETRLSTMSDDFSYGDREFGTYINSGESYSLTFTRTGGFMYSGHGFGQCTHDTGTIIVVEGDEEQAAMIEKVEEWDNQRR